MFIDLLQSPYFSVFLIVALGFMLGRVKVMGLSLDVSAVIFIAFDFWPLGRFYSESAGKLRTGAFYFYHRHPGGAGVL